MTRERYVYFAQCDFGGPIKIGFSYRPVGRILELQPTMPFNLVIIGAVEGEQFHERFLHAYFIENRIRGEWFEPVPELWRTAFEARTTGRIHFLPPAVPYGSVGNFIQIGWIRRTYGISNEMIAKRMGVAPDYLKQYHDKHQMPSGKYGATGFKYLAAISACLVRKGHSGDLTQFVSREVSQKSTSEQPKDKDAAA